MDKFVTKQQHKQLRDKFEDSLDIALELKKRLESTELALDTAMANWSRLDEENVTLKLNLEVATEGIARIRSERKKWKRAALEDGPLTRDDLIDAAREFEDKGNKS